MVTLTRGALGSRVCCTAAENDIGDAGATAFAAALEKNTTITSVNLGCASERGSEAGGMERDRGRLGTQPRPPRRRPMRRDRGDASALRVRALRLNGDADPGCFGVVGVLHRRRERHRRCRRDSSRGGAPEEHVGHVGRPRKCASVARRPGGLDGGIGGAWARSRARRAGALRCGERGRECLACARAPFEW